MSSAFEAAMLQEARVVVGKSTLRQKDIMVWRNTVIPPYKGETVFFLPDSGVYIAVLDEALPRRKAKE